MHDNLTVLLVDDHAVVRTGLKTYLGLADNISQVYECDRGETACQIYSQHQPDIVVLDLSMPGIGGFETIRRLLNRNPDCKILVFSIHDELIYVIRAIKAGAKGYIVKNSIPEMLTDAVTRIVQGETFIAPELAQKLAASMVANDEDERLKQLTAREFDIFCLLANGMTSRDIAEKLCLSYKTVCNHSTMIKEKLGTKSIAEMTLIATRQGLIHTV
jgi:DNA-binding NarL/FixJ family response regulator